VPQQAEQAEGAERRRGGGHEHGGCANGQTDEIAGQREGLINPGDKAQLNHAAGHGQVAGNGRTSVSVRKADEFV
jgi:hypothetical protein